MSAISGKKIILKAKTKNISIVLYKPKYAGNIGSVARAAKNMGISNIIVVGKAEFDREEMQQRSTHLAADVLDQIQYFERIDEVLGSFNYIVGTTARLGKARGTVYRAARGRSRHCQYFPEKQGSPSFRPGRYRACQ